MNQMPNVQSIYVKRGIGSEAYDDDERATLASIKPD